jgi:hypothetical protein
MHGDRVAVRMNFTGDGAFEQSHNALGSGSELKTQARVA